MGNYMSNQLSYRHTQRVVVKAAMETGGCGNEFRWALTDCAGRTAEEVQECIKSTSRLRRCMACNERHFKTYIKIMEKGLDQDEGKQSRYRESKEERWRWRWWTGMIRVDSPPPTSKT